MYQIKSVQRIGDYVFVESVNVEQLVGGGTVETVTHRATYLVSALDSEVVAISPCVDGDPTTNPPTPCTSQTVTVGEIRAVWRI